MKQNVLVFPCGSEIGLEIFRSISLSTQFNLIGGSSVDDHGQFVYKHYIGNIPFVNDPDFIDALNKIIEEHKIDFIFPAHDDVVLKLAQEKAAKNITCEVITSPLQTCLITRSKARTYDFFHQVLATPRVYELEEVRERDLPLFLKPDIGQGSKGTVLAKTTQDIKHYLEKDPSLLILENLPGKEYTVDCFTNKAGELIYAKGRERERILNGISVHSSRVEHDAIGKMAKTINNKLRFRGVWFFQVKENTQGKLVLMEIAPRVAGTMGLTRSKGVNLPLLSIFDAMGIGVETFENDYDIVIDRALYNRHKHTIDYRHVYLDFDDLVLIDSKINPQVMEFVYQCHNNNKKVYLITRHKGDLQKTLKKYRLQNAFDKIFWVKEGDEKYQYIKEKDAIFIDDSFTERKKVHDKCHIPVFDGHMIESLIEKF